jgi:hypothetical protein
MPRTRLGILAPAPILAVSGVLLAAVSVPDSSLLAVAILGLVGIPLTVLLARVQRCSGDRAFVRDLMLLAVAFRFLLLGLIHQTVGPYVFAPDQFTYEAWGEGILSHLLLGTPFPSRLQDTLQVGYPGLNALLFLVFGPAHVAAPAVNIYLSAWTAVPVYNLSRLLLPRRRAVARLAAGFTVLAPSVVLWSTLNIREAPTILAVVASVYFLVALQKRPDVAALAGVVVSLGLLTLLREYLTALVGVAGAAGVLMGRSRSPARSLAVGSVMLVGMTFAFQGLGLGASLTGEPTLERAQLLRESFQMNAGSAYGQGADVSTPAGALAYLPVGLAYFLLAPFPWDIGSTLQAITLPETILWWLVFPFGLLGALQALRRDARSFTVPLAVLVTVTFAYAMVESNVGTAYRHRAQVLPVGFILCALGLRHVQERALAARRARRVRRRRARERIRAYPGGVASPSSPGE